MKTIDLSLPYAVSNLPIQLGASALEASALPALAACFSRTEYAGHLYAWQDEVSGKLGFYQDHKVIVLDKAQISAVYLAFMRRAKGTGWIVLEANIKQQDRAITLLEARDYDEKSLAWLQARTAFFEDFFGLNLTLIDEGYDC
ncbi:hypothetical protein ACO0LC_09085 [Undibacterium sp. JH2W]|uniref:hypothetical protein n=1 Tax=Undibacterium sp. JH2W TaxID=3413037 RepID=UPI003BF0EA88